VHHETDSLKFSITSVETRERSVSAGKEFHELPADNETGIQKSENQPAESTEGGEWYLHGSRLGILVLALSLSVYSVGLVSFISV
jgi:hypothetical protein